MIKIKNKIKKYFSLIKGGSRLQESEQVLNAAEILSKCNHVVVLTGAGMSTESGIPDFRSPGSGIWNKMDPEDFTIERFRSSPERFYTLGMEFLSDILDSEPHEGHKALGEMESLGLIQAVITQNIDGLHQKGGSDRVIEVHGTLQSASCLGCQQCTSIDDILGKVDRGEIPPYCEKCGEVVKPDIILFGEAMPPAYQEALMEAQRADGVLVVGSSLVVSPANILPQFAERLVIINKDPTPYNSRADIIINEQISEVLPRLKEVLLQRKL